MAELGRRLSLALALSAFVLPAAAQSPAERLLALQQFAFVRCGGLRPQPEDLVVQRHVGEVPEPLPDEMRRRRARDSCWARTTGPYAIDARGSPSWPEGAEPAPPPDRATWRREPD